MYSRTYKDEKIMIIANNKIENREFELRLLERILSSNDILGDLKTGENIKFSIDQKLVIPGYDLGIYKITNSGK
jgi:hypothetical protein